MRLTGYLQDGLATAWNILAYAATRGRYLYLERRVRNGVFRN
jgi:hypothetical protein